MNNQPLITIITVVYNLIEANREQYFRQCLESVHNQSYKNIEHIIVDGASTDGTVELVKEYADAGWVKYLSEPDSGLYDAMNKGAALARGEYLAFLNSDDFYNDLGGIEKCIENLLKTDADFSYSKCFIINKRENLMEKHLHVEPNFENVFTDMPFSHQAMIVKAEVFKALGMYDLKYKSASDYDFILKMVFNKCKYTMCDCRLVTFRFGGFSIANMALSLDEVADFYQKFYGKFCPLTKEDAKRIYLKKELPRAILKNVLPYLKPQHKIKLVTSHFINSFLPLKILKAIFFFCFKRTKIKQ